jgi:hypothetical protein
VEEDLVRAKRRLSRKIKISGHDYNLHPKYPREMEDNAGSNKIDIKHKKYISQA